MDIAKRLKKVIVNKNKTLKDFSKEANIPYITLQKYIAGERKPGADALTKIHIQLGISINWLLTGKGEMYEKKGTEKVETLVGTIEWLKEWWDGADEKHRHWLEVQMKRCFPEYAKWADKE
ncbi:MAG: helix-turn-helix transcriptional regulator [Candidatus Parabeggiatoa sp.]|nr:helix-turn-helix transcriptional regulator [Candidatus Parabeggiatoa sp.]